MKTLLKLEYLAGFVLSLLLFSELTYAWWVYPVFFFAPDLGMVGYLVNTRVGALTYNVLHHLGVAVVIFGLGVLLSIPGLQLAGIIIIGHLYFDRVLGYGLKFPDSFKHTHLGNI